MKDVLKNREAIARMMALFILVGLPSSVLLYQFVIVPRLATHRVIDIAAAIPESGGFQPNSIKVETGETVTLRFRSTDVTHGVAIGPALGIDLGDIEPGRVKEVTLTFDKGGTYTFYCNTWCSVNHWRMRGIVDVVDPQHPNPTPQRDPVIERLMQEGVNIDANLDGMNSTSTENPADAATSDAMSGMSSTLSPRLNFPKLPSAERGKGLVNTLTIPSGLTDSQWRQSHTPREGLELLAKLNPTVAQDVLIDVIAYLWIDKSNAQAIASAATLYAKNCAACHGEKGDGQGLMAAQTVKKPVDFTDLSRAFNTRDDVLYAKIRRGGMGTDMPNFGTLFTFQETWELVNYLRLWAFNAAPVK